MQAGGAGGGDSWGWQWRTVEATEVVVVVVVAGVEAAGCCELAMQQLEEAGRSRHQWEEVWAVGAAAMVQWEEPAARGQAEEGQLAREGAAGVQPGVKGAASLARVKSEDGAASVAKGARVAATVSTLNAHAAEWKATADVLDDKFTG